MLRISNKELVKNFSKSYKVKDEEKEFIKTIIYINKFQCVSEIKVEIQK